ncbi:MAG: riboflavin synthase [Candidatus Anammoxibacter sp.]
MFTGIIEHLGKVENTTRKPASMVISVNIGELTNDVKEGDSISVNGICLTVTTIKGSVVTFDVLQETLSRTSLKDIKVSEKVNIERALKVGDRMGGHFVTGHIDGTGVIAKKIKQPGQTTLWVEVSSKLGQLMIEKGSIAIDGISLTLVEVKDTSFSVALIPYTLSETTLGFRDVGNIVNLELDMIGKWVKKIVSTEHDHSSGLTKEKLKDQGFA